MTTDLRLLLGTTAAVGFIHTVIGPDHYLPFVAMAKVARWSTLRAATTAALCGVGHVGSSVVIGMLGVALGWAVSSMQSAEAVRGQWAGWALIGFGLAYGLWGVRRGIRNRPHTHLHVHADGTMHAHSHRHVEEHSHVHPSTERANLTPWILFVIFVLGPCEPLIPLLMVPASHHSWWGLIMVTTVFGIVTIGTMTLMSLALLRGLNIVPLRSMERWTHALAGGAILACGAAIHWLGL